MGDISPGTQILTLGCAAPFCAVRLGFANISPKPYQIRKAIGAPSSSFSDYCNPTGGAPWTAFTFLAEGVSNNRIVTAQGAPTNIIVRGNVVDTASGEDLAPRWTWSDWVAISSISRSEPSDGLNVLMIRLLIEGNQTLTMPNGTFAAYTGNAAINKGFDYCTGWYPDDAVIHASEINPAMAHLRVNGTAVACVQFLTFDPGFTGIIAGDSHHQGTTTTTQFSNLLLHSTLTLGSELIGSIPFGYWATAFGGASTDQIFLALDNVIDQADPAFVVLPGWTFNDYRGSASEADLERLFFAKLMSAATLCRERGAVPIFLTPFPRDKDSMTSVRLKRWRSQRQTILKMQSTGAVVIDATSVLGRVADGDYDGTYLPQFTNDQIHPNDAGHVAISNQLTPIIRGICRL